MGLIAGVYPGMAMADPQGGRQALQWVVALFLTALALTGLWASPVFLAWAFFLHSGWSFLHQFTALGDGDPEGYPGFCFTYDLVLAGFVVFVWTAAH